MPKSNLEYCIIIECGSLQNPKNLLILRCPLTLFKIFASFTKRVRESIETLLSFFTTTFCEVPACLARYTEPKLPDPSFFCFAILAQSNLGCQLTH